MTKDPTIIHGCYKLATLILQRIFLRESLSQILSYDMYLYIMIDVRMCCLIQQVTTITKLFCHQIAFDDLSLKNKTRVATSRTSFNSWTEKFELKIIDIQRHNTIKFQVSVWVWVFDVSEWEGETEKIPIIISLIN